MDVSVTSRRALSVIHPGIVGVAFLSFGAAAIHFAVMGEHFSQYWLFGVFFSVTAWFQLLWGGLVTLHPARWLLRAGSLVNLAVVGVWVWSRTTGLPFGPGAGEPEPKALADVAATLFEVLLVIGTVAMASTNLRALRGKTGTIFGAVAAFGALVLSTTAIAGLGGESNQHTMLPADQVARVRPPSSAQLKIIEPAPGATVSEGALHVKLELTGGVIVSQTSTDLKPGEGHLHLSLDGKIVSMTYGLEQDVSAAKGRHLLTAEFVATDHFPFNPRVVATTTFIVT